MPILDLAAPNSAQQKPMLGAQVDWGHPRAQGLVFAALFNEGGGILAPAHDLVTGKPGTPTGTAAYGWRAGVNGPAFSYTGIQQNSYIDFGDLVRWDPVGAFTASALVQWSAGTDGAVMCKLDVSPYNGWMIWKNSVNYCSVYINGGIRANGSSGPTLANGQWVRITVVWDGATVFLYHDNRLATSGAYSTAPVSAGKTLKLNDYPGNGTTNGGSLFTFSDAFYWMRALRAGEIAQLFTNPYEMFGPSQRLWAVRSVPKPLPPAPFGWIGQSQYHQILGR